MFSRISPTDEQRDRNPIDEHADDIREYKRALATTRPAPRTDGGHREPTVDCRCGVPVAIVSDRCWRCGR